MPATRLFPGPPDRRQLLLGPRERQRSPTGVASLCGKTPGATQIRQLVVQVPAERDSTSDPYPIHNKAPHPAHTTSLAHPPHNLDRTFSPIRLSHSALASTFSGCFRILPGAFRGRSARNRIMTGTQCSGSVRRAAAISSSSVGAGWSGWGTTIALEGSGAVSNGAREEGGKMCVPDELAHLGVGHGHDCALRHARVEVQGVLYHRRRDVLPAADDL